MATMLKDGSVRPHNASGAMLIAHTIIAEVFAERGYDCVLTSANDDEHSAKSKHYHGDAFDYRSKHIGATAEKLLVLAVIRERLGVTVIDGKRTAGHYDVLLEHLNKPREHFHVEYDPTFRST